jgi:predicted nucleic acid-binding protein
MTATYVVDTSVVIQRFIADSYTDQTKALFSGLQQSDELWIPEFCLIECANVFWKRVRFSNMPQAQAEQLTIDLIALPLQIAPIKIA